MSIRQVIPALRVTLNRRSHLSGDNSHRGCRRGVSGGVSRGVPHGLSAVGSSRVYVPVSLSGMGRGRFSIAAAMMSGKRSGVQANAGAPSAPSAAACSWS